MYLDEVQQEAKFVNGKEGNRQDYLAVLGSRKSLPRIALEEWSKTWLKRFGRNERRCLGLPTMSRL
jgi:hypothetical protein